MWKAGMIILNLTIKLILNISLNVQSTWTVFKNILNNNSLEQHIFSLENCFLNYFFNRKK